MKNTLAIIFVLLGAATSAAAGDARFADFAVRQAHDRGFRSCDKGIRDVLQSAGGEDIRVFTNSLKPIASDQLQLAALWGKPGDTVLTDVTLRLKAGRCYVQASSTVIANMSCERWLNAQSAFSVTGTTVGVRISTNPGGVDAILTPAGDSCVVTYRRNGSY